MPRKAIKQKARTVKGWGKRAPKTQQQRRKLKERCGNKAFLMPKEMKYPIIAKTGPCVIDCQGLRAAVSRLGAMATTAQRAGRGKDAAKYRRVQKRARGIGKRGACHWAK